MGKELGNIAGGESGIRTHVRVSPKHAFQACAFNHSAISPVVRSPHRVYQSRRPDACGREVNESVYLNQRGPV